MSCCFVGLLGTVIGETNFTALNIRNGRRKYYDVILMTGMRGDVFYPHLCLD